MDIRLSWVWMVCTVVEVGRWGGAGVEAAWVRGAVFNPKVNARPPWPLGQPRPPPAPDQTQRERQRRYNSSLLFPHRQHDAAVAADDAVQRLTGQPRRLEVCERALHPYTIADASEQTVGRVTTLVGGCMGGFKDGISADARLLNPSSVAVSPDGALLLVMDGQKPVLRAVDLETQHIRTFEVSGADPYLQAPSGIAIKADGRTLFLTDRRDHQIFRLDVTYVAGEAAGSFHAAALAGVGHPGLRDGPASMAVLNTPTGLALADNETALYVADSMNHVIRKVHLTEDGSDMMVTTVAGTGDPGHVDGPLAEAQFDQPHGVVATADGGVLYVADLGNNCIRRISFELRIVYQGRNVSQKQFVTTYAGRQKRVAPSSVVPAVVAAFFGPMSLALSPDEKRLFVMEAQGRRVRMIVTSEPPRVTLMAGSRDCHGVPQPIATRDDSARAAHHYDLAVDGVGDGACFASPLGMALHPTENVLFVADAHANRIRHVRVQGDSISTASVGPARVTLAQTLLSSSRGDVNASSRVPWRVHATFTQPQPRFGAQYISVKHGSVVDGSLRALSADSTRFVFEVEAESAGREVTVEIRSEVFYGLRGAFEGGWESAHTSVLWDHTLPTPQTLTTTVVLEPRSFMVMAWVLFGGPLLLCALPGWLWYRLRSRRARRHRSRTMARFAAEELVQIALRSEGRWLDSRIVAD